MFIAGNSCRSINGRDIRVVAKSLCISCLSAMSKVVRKAHWRWILSWTLPPKCSQITYEANYRYIVEGKNWSRNHSRCCANDAVKTKTSSLGVADGFFGVICQFLYNLFFLFNLGLPSSRKKVDKYRAIIGKWFK